MLFLVISHLNNKYSEYNPDSPKIYAHKDSERILGYFKAPKPIIKLGKLKMAGRGKITNEYCGTYKESLGVYACECGHTLKINKLSCHSHFCPICYKFSAMTTANKIMVRTIAGKLKYHLRNSFHVVVSFDGSCYSDMLKNYNKYYKLTIEMLKQYFEGGSVFYHPYRLQNEILEFGAHFHAIVISNEKYPLPFKLKSGYVPEGWDDLDNLLKKNKCIIKIIKSKKDDSIFYNSQEKMLKTIYYELTHSVAVEYGKMYRYFGCLAYNKFKTKDIQYENVPVLCQKCDNKIYRIASFDIKEYHYNEKAVKKLAKLEHKYAMENRQMISNQIVKGVKGKVVQYRIDSMKNELEHLNNRLKIIDSIENIRFDKTDYVKRQIITAIEVLKPKTRNGKLYKIKKFGGSS